MVRPGHRLIMLMATGWVLFVLAASLGFAPQLSLSRRPAPGANLQTQPGRPRAAATESTKAGLPAGPNNRATVLKAPPASSQLQATTEPGKPAASDSAAGGLGGLLASLFGRSDQAAAPDTQSPAPPAPAQAGLLEAQDSTVVAGPPAGKLIPDSEFVYGPGSKGFDIAAAVDQFDGRLAGYHQALNGVNLSGAQIVEKVARDFSVSPRLLLAILEQRSGWVTGAGRAGADIQPIVAAPKLNGLYAQLQWAADTLNRGYYLRRVNAIQALTLSDGSSAPLPGEANPGTAGLLAFMAQFSSAADWQDGAPAAALMATYLKLFGDPRNRAVEPLLSDGLAQPQLELPFEPGVAWVFSGGPHASWGEGSAWGALDFAPRDAGGSACAVAADWVTAAADGLIVRSEDGAVVEDLSDGAAEPDGSEATGWSLLYMHLAEQGRVPAGTRVKTGDHLGHPSCEGGVATGTHTHLARRYNGEWISADQNQPFNLSGWISSGGGKEYAGALTRNGQTLPATTSGSSMLVR